MDTHAHPATPVAPRPAGEPTRVWWHRVRFVHFFRPTMPLPFAHNGVVSARARAAGVRPPTVVCLRGTDASADADAATDVASRNAAAIRPSIAAMMIDVAAISYPPP